MIAIPLLLQVNEHATPKGIKLSCNVDAEAECGEEPTGLADPTPDSTEASPTPLSGWEDENCPVPVSPASSMDCKCHARTSGALHIMYVLFSTLSSAGCHICIHLPCVRLMKTTLVQHTTC